MSIFNKFRRENHVASQEISFTAENGTVNDLISSLEALQPKLKKSEQSVFRNQILEVCISNLKNTGDYNGETLKRFLRTIQIDAVTYATMFIEDTKYVIQKLGFDSNFPDWESWKKLLDELIKIDPDKVAKTRQEES